jgi:hypothetical protein
MSVLDNPTLKSLLMIVVVLAVLGGVAYLIYHFTAGASSGDVTTTTTTNMVSEPDMHQMSMEGFAGCPTRNQEGFDSMPPVERNAEEAFTNPEPAEQQHESVSKPVAADNTLGMNQMPSECYPKDVLSSVDLLPSDANSHYAMVNPNGQGALSDQNFLTAGYHIGINTVGQTLRNANRQLRSDPPCPQVAVSPWNNTTIEYDGNRRPLEIGGAP